MPRVFASVKRWMHPTRYFVLMPFNTALDNVYAVLKGVPSGPFVVVGGGGRSGGIMSAGPVKCTRLVRLIP